MNAEIWKSVTGYEGMYEVSDLGRVRSLDRQVEVRSRWGRPAKRSLKGRILAQGKFPNGYLNVMLPDGKRHLVHRLVAREFVQGFREELQVNHLNADRADNFAGNLEWATCRENHLHAHQLDSRKRHSLRVRLAMALPEGPAVFESLKDAVRYLARAHGRELAAGSLSSALTSRHLAIGYPVWSAQ